MPKFEVELTRATYAYATVEVEAVSEEEAKHLVEKKLQDSKFDPEEEDVKFGVWEVEDAEEIK
jgi:hypothetical protein